MGGGYGNDDIRVFKRYYRDTLGKDLRSGINVCGRESGKQIGVITKEVLVNGRELYAVLLLRCRSNVGSMRALFTRPLMHLLPLEGRIRITGSHKKVVRKRRKLAPCHEGKQQQGCNMFSLQAHAIKLFIPVYEYTSALRLFQSSLMKLPDNRPRETGRAGLF